MLKIKDIMTSEIFVLDSDQNLSHVRSLMETEQIRHVPIVDKSNNFVGLLTHRDLLAFTISRLAGIEQSEQHSIDEQIRIKDVMKSDISTADPDMALRDAISIMLDNKYGCLPVVIKGKLVGIVTESDFLKFTQGLLNRIEER